MTIRFYIHQTVKFVRHNATKVKGSVLLKRKKTPVPVVYMNTKLEDLHKCKLQEIEKAAILLQSFFRMHLTRSRIIFPKELLPFLQKKSKGIEW